MLPEIQNGAEEVSKLSLGLLSEGRIIAEKVGGNVTALIFGEKYQDFSEILARYGATRLLFFQDPLLRYPSAEACTAAVLANVRQDNPWLGLMGHSVLGRELAPRLAALLNTGLVTDCVKIDLEDPQRPKFYRPVYGGQLYQEIVDENGCTMLLTMDPDVLNIKPASITGAVETLIIEPKLAPGVLKTRHEAYLTADYQKMDITEAGTIVGAGMGATDAEILQMVEELAGLCQGVIGTTRPVVDEGKIPREALIGQTGKIVSPDFYLALGISGASHHVGGVQDSGKIVAINRDAQAPIFRSSDVGIAVDLKDILPRLINRVKQAKANGEII